MKLDYARFTCCSPQLCVQFSWGYLSLSISFRGKAVEGSFTALQAQKLCAWLYQSRVRYEKGFPYKIESETIRRSNERLSLRRFGSYITIDVDRSGRSQAGVLTSRQGVKLEEFLRTSLATIPLAETEIGRQDK